MPADAYDLVIVGAGTAGLAAAITLRKLADVSVLIIDAGRSDKVRPGESIPPAALSCISFLGMRNHFDCAGHFAYPGHASVWGRDLTGFNDALLDPLGPPWRLDRSAFDQMMQIVTTDRGATIAWETQYINQQPTVNGYELMLHDRIKRKRYTVCAKMVIDASGSGAHFARSLGIRTVIDDRLVAVVRFNNIVSGKLTAQTLLEADPNGWWYAARLPDNKLVSMYVTEAHTLRQMNADIDKNFSKGIRQTSLLSKHLEPVVVNEHHFYTFPVYSSILETAYGSRWLAAGDAALCYDPISAQGIYKGLVTGIKAGKTALTMLNNGMSDKLPDTTYPNYIKDTYQSYIEQRNQLYQQEQRWPHSFFWQKRIKKFIEPQP
ncbi:FAD-dependent monooxygenase [Mucilaginibacter sp. KACC 22063]|uniref:FAD-dependent monooxygenase n=1 Tax=Mucilaginibacter sp. KACC 22063 TaxID=3025666 RepID=UPI0023661BFA|nr:FAD-dependent monooxygenase [Mucilaginibacter sp. KACC 22063]WDF53957.1 FAD-dependent monooxygenase [Mucilaginibacter sp. KACC 22063]